MAQDATQQAEKGWTRLSESPAGFPEAEYVRLAPLLEEVSELQAHVARSRAINADSAEVKAMEFCLERIRRQIWAGLELIEEATPKVLAAQLGVSAQTIRNWANDPAVPVRHRRRGKAYFVDVRSAREYAAAL